MIYITARSKSKEKFKSMTVGKPLKLSLILDAVSSIRLEVMIEQIQVNFF